MRLCATRLPLDYVIDEHKGNVSKPEIQHYWLAAIKGAFGVGVGPPCETWSKVRNVTLTAADGQTQTGPRVLRQSDCPWGRPSLRLKEVRQLITGNVLLGFALHCLAAIAVYGGCSFMEHPQEPEEQDYVSIWRLPIVNFLLQLQDTQMLTLAQGLFSSESAKPTQLSCILLGARTEHRDNPCKNIG